MKSTTNKRTLKDPDTTAPPLAIRNSRDCDAAVNQLNELVDKIGDNPRDPRYRFIEAKSPIPPSTRLMEGERIVFTHEVEPTHGVRVLATGEIDDSVLDALELYIQLQKKRLERDRKAAKQAE